MTQDHDYVTQIEGHGKIVYDFDGGKANVKLEVHEGSRLFEAFLRGRRADEVPQMSSRICGVCPVVHNYAAIMAVENAMQIKPSEQTEKLRRLGIVGQMLQSHALHLYVLALPEYLGAGTPVELYTKAPDAVVRALKIRGVGNDIVETVSGRAVHPINSVPGGFGRVPAKKEIRKLLNSLKGVLDDCIATAKFVETIKFPKFERKTEYSALDDGKNFPSYGGKIVSTEGVNAPLADYKKYTNEVVREYSPTKFSSRNGHGFVVSSLARVNLFQNRLYDKAKDIAKNGKVKFPNYNPFNCLVAQGIELVHYCEEGIALAEDLAGSIKDETVPKVVRAGYGVGSVEAPRGTLFHAYRVNSEGIVMEADIITPTAQNVYAIEDDLKQLLNENIKKPKTELKALTESLLRAYDPCFSCSTH
jgi:sulfhydrogenase subunit alpha